MSKADLDKTPFDVARMFDAVGEKYDLTNTVLSFGQDAHWRKRTRERLNLKPGEKVLDLAAGTAVSTVELSKSGAWCVACDFSRGMLAAGRERDVPKVAGDGMNLPFADNTFDAVTISYGLRNIHDFELGLREMARVTKPGGRLAVAEFSTPVVPIFGTVYKEYLMRLLPPVARLVSSNPEAYIYLAESIRAWPGQEELAAVINRNGWAEAGWQNLTFGIVAPALGGKASLGAAPPVPGGAGDYAAVESQRGVSRRRDETVRPAARQVRAMRSRSSSVMRLPIRRAAAGMSMRPMGPRRASGPASGRNCG